MSAEADLVCRASYGEVSPERTNRRNWYRIRRWDTRVGTIDLKIPKLRAGSYSRIGCWTPGPVRSGRSSSLLPNPDSRVCPPGGLRSWSRRLVFRRCPSLRCRNWSSTSTEWSRRHAQALNNLKARLDYQLVGEVASI